MKLFLILFFSAVSIISQINLKATSGRIPMSLFDLKTMGYFNFFLLLGRVGFFSGMSLLVSWLCYRKFGFLELIVAQSITYVFAIGASSFVFQEPVTWNKLGAVFLILLGIGCFYLPSFRT